MLHPRTRLHRHHLRLLLSRRHLRMMIPPCTRAHLSLLELIRMILAASWREDWRRLTHMHGRTGLETLMRGGLLHHLRTRATGIATMVLHM